MNTYLLIASIIIGLIIIALLIVLLIRISKMRQGTDLDAIRIIQDEVQKNSQQTLGKFHELSGNITGLYQSLQNVGENVAHINTDVIKEMHAGFKELSTENNEANQQIVQSMQHGMESLTKANQSAQDRVITNLSEGLDRIQNNTNERLALIQGDVNKKLDISLNQRLDENFKQVSQQLTDLYKSLGELSQMSDGIQSLNKTLSNVKTRGTWGEVQLDSILQDTLPAGQYEKNIKLTRTSEDFVEFAVKIPSKDNSKEFIYLPIDSKFPMDRYNHVLDAATAGDAVMLKTSTRELADQIKLEARKIRDKYVCPPVTTDFAIMFLPTESLYAEVLRIDGLAEFCQNEYRIVISGPTTITALLNSLRIGFANLALNEKANEVRKILGAVKTQYTKFSELIEATHKKLDAAVKSTDDLQKRAQIIQKHLSKVDELDLTEADRILQIDMSASANAPLDSITEDFAYLDMSMDSAIEE